MLSYVITNYLWSDTISKMGYNLTSISLLILGILMIITFIITCFVSVGEEISITRAIFKLWLFVEIICAFIFGTNYVNNFYEFCYQNILQRNKGKVLITEETMYSSLSLEEKTRVKNIKVNDFNFYYLEVNKTLYLIKY